MSIRAAGVPRAGRPLLVLLRRGWLVNPFPRCFRNALEGATGHRIDLGFEFMLLSEAPACRVPTIPPGWLPVRGPPGPVASAIRLMPPRPIARASTAAQNRRASLIQLAAPLLASAVLTADGNRFYLQPSINQKPGQGSCHFDVSIFAPVKSELESRPSRSQMPSASANDTSRRRTFSGVTNAIEPDHASGAPGR